MRVFRRNLVVLRYVYPGSRRFAVGARVTRSSRRWRAIVLVLQTHIAEAFYAIRRGVSRAVLTLALGTLSGTAHAQDRSWFDRVLTTKAEQPRWMTPLVTVTPRLEQE